MPAPLTLLPAPRHITLTSDSFPLTNERLIVIDHDQPPALFGAARRWQTALRARCDVHWGIVASRAAPAAQVALTLRLAPEAAKQPQGYALTIASDGIRIDGHDAAGVFYGVCTLIQILEQSGAALPCLTISDWPDFPARGVMLDVSRDKVPTMATLYALVEMLAGWKINQLQLYLEHTFAYQPHAEVWAEASPFTGQEILELDAFCRERFIELVPNQNTFGHMHRWLEHPRYAALAEAPDGFDFPWGTHSDGPFSLNPTDPRSLELVAGLMDELLPHFTSRQFNIGCDETFDLGAGRSKAECEQRGEGVVYMEYLLKVCAAAKTRGFRPQFWGDIIVQHPELIAELPKSLIAMEWGYEADHPFDSHGEKFAAAGLEYHVCAGTSSWNTIAGRTHNALGNLLSAAENGLKHGATGFLNTDWGDNGHWQMLPVSYLGFMMGAAYAWALEANRAVDVPQALSLHAFSDAGGALGHVAHDLGNVYRVTGIEPHNSSALFHMLQMPLSDLIGYRDTVPAEVLHQTLAAIDAAVGGLSQAHSTRPDAALLQREFMHTARMLRHACHRTLWAYAPTSARAAELRVELQDIVREYHALWLARNRPGGLKDSVRHFDAALAGYADALPR